MQRRPRFHSNFGMIPGHFQSNSRAAPEQFQNIFSALAQHSPQPPLQFDFQRSVGYFLIFRAISEQFQSNFRAISGQFQSNFRSKSRVVLEQFLFYHSAIPVQINRNSRAVSGQFQSNLQFIFGAFGWGGGGGRRRRESRFRNSEYYFGSDCFSGQVCK